MSPDVSLRLDLIGQVLRLFFSIVTLAAADEPTRRSVLRKRCRPIRRESAATAVGYFLVRTGSSTLGTA